MAAMTVDTRFWNRVARKYATDAIKDAAGYERTLNRTRQYLSSTDAVLELGCGTGTTALRLAPHVRRLVATDISPEMVTIAREKAAARGCANVEFRVAPADHALRPESAFDAVLAFNLLHLLAERRALFQQALGLLKPGGLFITKTPCLAEMNRLIRLAVPLMRVIGKAPNVEFFTAVDLEGEVEVAGFTIIERARHGSGRKDARIFIAAKK
jgi:ubiquinone/menaquinone biosynthesis C-methylase UbiE